MALASRPLASRPLASNEVSASNTTLSIPAASLVLTDQLPTLSLSLAMPAASLVLTDQLPRLGFSFGMPAASLSLTDQAPALQIGTNLNIPAASLLLTDQVPSLALSFAMPAAGIVLTDFAPTVIAPQPQTSGGAKPWHRGTYGYWFPEVRAFKKKRPNDEDSDEVREEVVREVTPLLTMPQPDLRAAEQRMREVLAEHYVVWRAVYKQALVDEYQRIEKQRKRNATAVRVLAMLH
jgi:hypothetical protein